jgi:hypothetical protein
MGLLDWIFGRKLGPPDLARRLGPSQTQLEAIRIEYHEFTIPKRSGQPRPIQAPAPELRAAQRLILRRLLGRLKAHPSAHGFERGRSIVTHARVHAGQAVIIHMDIQDFFPSTKAKTIDTYFKKIGWNSLARAVLIRLCTHKGSLPQGAPTSPRLSNLVNRKLDVRLQALADKYSARYSRYADDLAFSFAADDSPSIKQLICTARHIVEDCGYALHMKRKLHIRRQHQRQLVTGLVVNDGKVRLPRQTRRWLRAVEHRARTGRGATLTPTQLRGWRALAAMVAK